MHTQRAWIIHSKQEGQLRFPFTQVRALGDIFKQVPLEVEAKLRFDCCADYLQTPASDRITTA